MSSPHTGQLSYQCCSLVKTGQSPKLPSCTPRREAENGPPYPGDAVLFPAQSQAPQTSVRRADCPGLSRACTAAVPVSASGPSSVPPLMSRWQQTQQRRQLQARGSQASRALESWQTQRIYTAATKRRRVLPSAQPREFSAMTLMVVK